MPDLILNWTRSVNFYYCTCPAVLGDFERLMEKLITEHYLSHFNMLHKRANRTLGDWHLAQDCVQETYERALKYAHTKGDGELGAWMNVVFFNTMLKYLKFIREKGITTEPKPSDDVMFPPSFASDHENILIKEIALYNVKSHVKEVLHLSVMKGYTNEEVNLLTNISENAIKGHKKRFRQYLLDKYT